MIDYPNGPENGHTSSNPLDYLPPPALSDDLRYYLGLAWRWSWLLILLTLIGGAAGYFFSSRETPIYQATATMWITEPRGLTEGSAGLAGERITSTYVELMTQLPVLQAVIDELGLRISPQDLKGTITVSILNQTQLLIVRVENADPLTAARIANTIGVVFTEINQEFQTESYADSKAALSSQLAQVDGQIQDANRQLSDLFGTFEQIELEDGSIQFVPTLDQQRERDRLEANLALYQQIYSDLLQSYENIRLAEIQGSSKVTMVEPALTPTRPVRPNVFQATALAAVVGLFVAGGVVFLIEALDDTVKGPNDVHRHLGLPVLGYVYHYDNAREGLPTVLEPRSPIAEAYRSLRTNVQSAENETPIRTLMITSPSPKDGKSQIAANLTVVMAQGGKRAVLLDADLRRPTQHKLMNLPNRVGLTDLVADVTKPIDAAMKATSVPYLRLVSSGGLPPNPAEVLGSEKMMEILRTVRDRSDIVLVDTPPALAVTDAVFLASKVDAVLLVLKPGTTKISFARQTVEQLLRNRANIIGVVLNDIKRGSGRYGYYANGYYHYYQTYYGSEATKQK
jgi:non-specific protein-tyrosine kinase